MKGLLGRRALEPGAGLFLRPARSVHTAFMRFAIDVVFLDRDLTVLGFKPNLRPWRVAAWRGAHVVLELRAGECERRGIRIGQRLDLMTSQEGQEGQAPLATSARRCRRPPQARP
jgi:uncharacterized membrane protein (UPF0127 family)